MDLTEHCQALGRWIGGHCNLVTQTRDALETSCRMGFFVAKARV